VRLQRLLLPARICTERSGRCFRNFVRSIGYGGRPGHTLLDRFVGVAGGWHVPADVGVQAGATNWRALNLDTVIVWIGIVVDVFGAACLH